MRKPTSSQVNTRDAADQSAGIVLVGTAILALLGFSLSWLAAAEFWAFAPWLQFPLWLRLVLLAGIVLAAIPLIGRLIARVIDTLSNQAGSSARPAVAVICALVLTIVLLTLRSENHILGDGLTIISRLQSGDIFSATEPLTYLLNFLLMKSFLWSEHAAIFAFRVAGVAAAILLLVVAYRRAIDTREFLLIVVSTLGFGVVQFFAGYVENYTYAFVAGLLCLFNLCRDWTRERLGPLSTVLLLLALGLHLAAAVFIPAYLFVWHRRLRHPRRTTFVGALGLLIVSCGFAYLWRAGLLGQTFVPLVATELNPYHLFSLQHLFDLANVLLRNFAILPLLLLLPSFRKLPQRNLLLVALTPALLFTIFVDPKIGAVRDWDLLSIASAPTIVAVILTLRSMYQENRIAALQLLVPLACFGILHTGSWLWLNHGKQRGYEFVKEYIHYDVHYSAEYYDGYRLIPWHVLAYNTYDDTDEAVRALEMHLRNHPDDIYNAYQLAVIKSLAGETEAAANLVRDRWYPYLLEEPRMAWELSRVFHRAGAVDEHEAVLRSYLLEKGDQDVITFELGSVLRDRGQLDSAWTLQATVLARRNMLPLHSQVDFALFAIERGQLGVAAGMFRELASRLPAPYSSTAASLGQALSQNDVTRIVSLRQSMLHFLRD